VLDVIEEPDGRVLHCLEGDPGMEMVCGSVNAKRRRDHMQQHTGQHLLSATCLALMGRQTVSFHLGSQRCSIDLPGEPPDQLDLDAVERRANEVAWEGRAVRTRILGREELDTLRKPPPPGVEAVRVVEIEGWDTSACCGTHVRSTSEVGLIKLLAVERVRSDTRLHFICGHRALEECANSLRRQQELVGLLTCHPDELAGKCARLQSELKSLRKASEALRAEVAAAKVVAWIEESPRAAGVALVVRQLESGGSDSLGAAASAVAARGGVAILGLSGERASLLFMCPESLHVDLRPAMQAACTVIDGRGGGPKSRVQGSGKRPQAMPEALAAARDEVLRQMGVDPGAFDKPGAGA
jgi:alanyl-tRNA synthetase